MEVKVISPFSMGGQKHNIGDIIDVSPEKVKDLEYQKLIEVKVMSKPSKDKMVKSPVKTKTRGKK